MTLQWRIAAVAFLALLVADLGSFGAVAVALRRNVFASHVAGIENARRAVQSGLDHQTALLRATAGAMAREPLMRAVLGTAEMTEETLQGVAEASRHDLGLDGLVLLDPEGRVVARSPVELDSAVHYGEILQTSSWMTFVSGADVWLGVGQPVDLGNRRLGWIVAADRIDEDLLVEVGELTGTATVLVVDGVVRSDHLRGVPAPPLREWAPGTLVREGDLLVRAVPLGERAEMLLVHDLADVQARFREASIPLLGIGFVTFVLAAMLAAIVARSVAAPLQRLTRVAQGIALGGEGAIEGARTDLSGSGFGGEAEQLRVTFVHMLVQLDSSRRTIVERNRMLGASLAAIEDALSRAVAADRAKSVFLANMSHELRTPLNAIIGYSELLQEESDDGTASVDLDRIKSSARHLLGLIDGVLDLSKVEAGRMEVQVEPFSLAHLVEDVVATATPLVSRNGNQLEVEQAASLDLIVADRAKLKQILLNLLSNAAKFTRDGQIWLRLRVEHVPHRLVAVVEDSGIGIDGAHLSEIFQPFHQGHASSTSPYGGTGLGLAISRQFAELMGGVLTVRSSPGRGSSFTATVPLGNEPRARARPTTRTAPLVLFAGSGMLVADGFLIVQVPASEVSTVARRLNAEMIVLEVQSEEGWKLVRALASSPELALVPVVVASPSDERARALELGANEHVVRPGPCKWEEVLTAVAARPGRRASRATATPVIREPREIPLVVRSLG